MKLSRFLIVVTLASAFAAVALAGTPHPVGKWCMADQQQFCKGMEWGTGLGKCLHANKDQVSALCKQHHPRLFGANPPPPNSTGE